MPFSRLSTNKTAAPLTGRAAVLLFVLLALVVLIGLVIAVHNLLADNTPGIDLFVFWTSGRALFVDGLSPYDPQVNQQVQLSIFGRMAEQGEDPMLYAFPPYGLLPVLPLLALPFDWAQAIWFVLYLVIIFSLPLLLFPRAPRWISMTLIAVYPITFSLILGNFVFLMGMILLLVCGLIVLRGERSPSWQVVAGLLLAWTTIKPQFVWLYLLFLALFALRQRLWWLAGSFGGGLLLMLLFSWLVLPGWLPDWLKQVQDYARLNEVQSVMASYLSIALPAAQVTLVNSVLLGLFLLVTLWLLLRWWRGSLGNLPMLAWVGLVTHLFDPRAISYEQITIIVPFFLWMATRQGKSVRLLWPAVIVVSWALFALAIGKVIMNAADLIPILLYAVWAGWVIIRDRTSQGVQVL